MFKLPLIIILLLGLLSGCAATADLRPLTDAEIAQKVAAEHGTLLKAMIVGTSSIILMDQPDGKSCHMLKTRDIDRPSGLSVKLSSDADPGKVSVASAWSSDNKQGHVIFCITIDDPQLQAKVARVQLTLEDGTSTMVESAGEIGLIVGIPSATRQAPTKYQVRFLDQNGQVLHTFEAK